MHSPCGQPHAACAFQGSHSGGLGENTARGRWRAMKSGCDEAVHSQLGAASSALLVTDFPPLIERLRIAFLKKETVCFVTEVNRTR